MYRKEQDGIYNELKNKSIKINIFFGRELITVSQSDFKFYEKYFESCFSLFNKKENFRTDSAFKHIHAIKDANLVEFHYDYGNFKKYPIFYLFHFFIDVLPYFIWHLIKLKKPYDISKNVKC
jgi:hypothetical protein